MASPRFLVDEDVPGPLVQALRQREPSLDILCVGEAGAPPRQTPDPQNLLAAESMGRMLLTADRRSMQQHLDDHYRAGHHTWGVLLMKNGYTLQHFLTEILLIWGATSADEWRDVTLYLP